MYGSGNVSALNAAGGTTSAISGIALLPNTSGNSLAMVLAYAAIALGVMILVSQIGLRIARRMK